MQGEIQRRIRGYLLSRLAIAVIGFGLVTFYLACLTPAAQEATCIYLYSLLGFQLLTAVGAFLTFPLWKSDWRLFRLQVIVDCVVLALLVWSTGGVLSIFTPVLFVTLAATASLQSPRGALLLAGAITVFLIGTAILYWAGVVPPTSGTGASVFRSENSSFVLSYLVASVLGLFVISALGSRLSLGLRHAESLQSEILENMAEGIIAVDREGRILRCNREAQHLLGISRACGPVRGRLLAEVIREGNRQGEGAVLERLLAAFSSRDRRRLELSIEGADGVRRPVEVKISSVLDDQGRCRYRIALLSDLSLKREIEAAERRIQKLEELQIMAMGIAHELRNPLASVRGCVQELARGLDDPLRRRLAGIVLKESDRLDRIIEEFTQYARSGPIDLKPLDLREVVERACDLLRARPDFGRRILVWRRPETPLEIFGDPDRLLQVLLNLGINAIQATNEETGRIEIGACAAETPPSRLEPDWNEDSLAAGWIVVEVRDNGAGIEEGDDARLFTPFYTTKENGTGLGLSIVERIVRGHGGRIAVRGRPREGTTVTISLPRRGNPAAAASEKTRASQARAPGVPPSDNGVERLQESRRVLEVSHA